MSKSIAIVYVCLGIIVGILVGLLLGKGDSIVYEDEHWDGFVVQVNTTDWLIAYIISETEIRNQYIKEHEYSHLFVENDYEHFCLREKQH